MVLPRALDSRALSALGGPMGSAPAPAPARSPITPSCLGLKPGNHLQLPWLRIPRRQPSSSPKRLSHQLFSVPAVLQVPSRRLTETSANQLHYLLQPSFPKALRRFSNLRVEPHHSSRNSSLEPLRHRAFQTRSLVFIPPASPSSSGADVCFQAGRPLPGRSFLTAFNVPPLPKQLR